MSELLVLVKESDGSEVAKPGDVVAAHQDHGRWGKEDRSHARWRIIRTERPLLDSHLNAFLTSPPSQSFHGVEHFRNWAIDLSKLPNPERFQGARSDEIIDVPAQVIEDATFQRKITGNVSSRPVPMTRAAALLAMIPMESRKKKPSLFGRRAVLRGVVALCALALLRRTAEAATITKSIGSAGGRDYADVQSFFTALPSNLVTDGNSYVGECYNDSEFTSSGTLANITVSYTTDATHTIKLTAAAGQSFQDNAGVRTNGLRYNASNGVGLRKTGPYGGVIYINATIQYLTVSRLQLKSDSSSPVLVDVIGGNNNTFKDLIAQGGTTPVFDVSGSNTVAVNVVGIATGASNTCFKNASGNPLFLGCTAVRPSSITAAGIGFGKLYGTPILQSCAVFGFTTCVSAGYDGSASKNNATDQASGLPGSSNQHNVTYSSATPFTQADAGSPLDFRAIASTSLAANGFRDTTNAPNDISGTARVSAPTIGVWEIASAATGSRSPARGTVM